MLLFTRERFYLNFIQVQLQGGQSIFQHWPHQGQTQEMTWQSN